MDFQAGVRARLLADSTVSGIVGTRIDWMTRPQKSALPSISLQTISDSRPDHLKGFDGSRATRVQCDCWAATVDGGPSGYSTAMALARAVIAALQQPATISGKKFGNARVDAQRDLGEKIADSSFIYRQSVDFIIWHVGD